MRNSQTPLLVLLVFSVLTVTCAPVDGGWWIFGNDNQECQCPNCQAEEDDDDDGCGLCSCFHIKRAPEGEIGLSLPATLSDNQGLRISEEDLRTALDDDGDDLGDSGEDDPSGDLEELRLRVERLSATVEKLTEIMRAETGL